MVLRTGDSEVIPTEPARFGNVLAVNEITIFPPSAAQVHDGGLRLTPLHEILTFAFTVGNSFPPKPDVPVKAQWPAELPRTLPIVTPEGGDQ